MKKIAIAVVTGAICLAMATAFAGIGFCQYDETKVKDTASATAPVKVNNTICPVMGAPVNMQDPVTIEYKGKIYNLCCPMCPATFKADPEKYSKIVEDQAKGK